MESDAALLRRYAEARDQGAFAELVRRHLDGVYSSALRRLGGDTHLAEDVAQKVFVELAQQARRLSLHPLLAGWLYTTTRNHAANTVRAEQRRKIREREADVMTETLPDSSSDLEWSRVAPVLDWAIDQLNDQDRAAVLLRFIDRKSFLEIGAALKLSDDAARMRVDRALEKLRLVLAHRGISSTAAAVGAAMANHAVMATPVGFASMTTAAAVAAGLAAVTPLSVFLEIMTTSKLAAGVASGLAILLGLGTATYEINARQQAETGLARKEQEYQGTLAQLDQIRQRIDQTNTATVALEKSVADEQAAFAVTAAAADAERKRTAGASDPKAVGRAFMLRHPEVKAAFVDYLTAKENSNYDRLFKSLRLTPTQIEEFRFLMREYALFGRSLDFESKDYAQFSVSTDLPKEEVQRRLRALLGEEGFRQYSEVRQQLPIRNVAAQAAAGLIFTEAPITPEQARQFISILSRNRMLDGTGSRVDWDAVKKDAEQTFFPSQISVIGKLQAQDEFNQALNAKSNTKSPLLSSSTGVSK